MGLNEVESPEDGELTDLLKLKFNERIHGIYADDPITTERLVSLAIELELISADILHALPSEFERRKLILLFAAFLGNRIEYCNIKRDRDPIVTRIEMMIPCGLHNNIRIPSNLLTHLRKEVNARQDFGLAQKKLLGEKLEETISKSIGSGTSANFKYAYKGSMLQAVSLSQVKLTQVMDNWASLVNVVFVDLNDDASIARKLKWSDLGERFVDCMLLLNYKWDMTPTDVIRFQLCCDLFCSLYRELLGDNSETKYIHNMSSGVFRYFANSYGSIYAYNNTAMEAIAGREQDFFQKGTQHDVDGHRGKTLIETFLDHHMIERAALMDKLVPGTLKASVKSGKTILNPERNKKDRENRLKKKQKQMEKVVQGGDINIVGEGEIVRVAVHDNIGKRTFVTLKQGDIIPTKPKRHISEKKKLQNLICNKLKIVVL